MNNSGDSRTEPAGMAAPSAASLPDIEFPVPPQEYAGVFLPILEGVRAGLNARKSLAVLTEYCVDLMIALDEGDRRLADAAAAPDSASKNCINGHSSGV